MSDIINNTKEDCIQALNSILDKVIAEDTDIDGYFIQVIGKGREGQVRNHYIMDFGSADGAAPIIVGSLELALLELKLTTLNNMESE